MHDKKVIIIKEQQLSTLLLEKPSIDEELEELNTYRKLPFYLEDSEKIFYNNFERVSIKILDDMYKQYLSNAHTHENDDISNDEDIDEYEQSNNDSLETYNEDDEELKLSKKNSELLEEIPLKKERSSKNKSKSIEFKEMGKEEKKKESFSNENNNNNNSFNNNDMTDLKEKIEEEDEEFDFPALKLK